MRKTFLGITLKKLIMVACFLVITIIVSNVMTIRQFQHVDDVILTGMDGPFVLAESRMITIGFIPMILGTFYEIIFSTRTSNNILIRNSGRKEIVYRELLGIIMGSVAAFILSMIISSVIAAVKCDGNIGLYKLSGNIVVAILKVVVINSLEISIVLTVFDILRNVFAKNLPPIIILYAFCAVFGVYPRTSKMSAVFGVKVEASSYYREAFSVFGVKVMIAAIIIELVLAGMLMMIVRRKDYLR